MRQFVTANAFVLGMGIVVGLAALSPELGAMNGPLPVSALKSIGIFAIFFLQGTSLPMRELRRGLADWKLHLCVQSTTFVFFPLVTSTALFLIASGLSQPDLRMGFLYLSFLPTTIASAIALTANSRGNVSGALFNTTVSNIGGIFLVPILCLGFLDPGQTGTPPRIGPILFDIAVIVLLPLAIGQCLRIFLRHLAERYRGLIRRFNNGVILFIIYAAFCDSFVASTWSSVEPSTLLKTVGGVLSLLGIASLYVWLLSGTIRLDRRSRVAALLCGSQKTLAVGLPLAVTIFGTDRPGADLSLILLPLLIYHPAQLILGGWLAPRLARYVENTGATGE